MVAAVARQQTVNGILLFNYSVHLRPSQGQEVFFTNRSELSGSYQCATEIRANEKMKLDPGEAVVNDP